jgi:glycosyltransferase involved in cell wall biosynthesis
VLTPLPLTHLNTRGFDITLFTDVAPIRLASSTQKIVLYHDGLPVTASDTICNERHIRWHIRSTQQCATDSLFVCISPEARHGLERISSHAAQNAHVIPNILPRMQRVSTTRENLLNIAQLRLSSTFTEAAQNIEGAWFKTDSPNGIPPYILSVATIEPRKNYPALIEAWRRLCLLTGQEIKLMIVGSPGWLYQPILREMQPFIQQGMLLHLEKVAQEELPYLYSGAQCFIFPSVGEGFGLPPCEAMQCGCPVLLSDIPAHRYIGADAALYFDPYDAADIAAKLKMILLDENHNHLSADLIKKGFNNIQRFSAEAVLPQWEALFRETASKQRKFK